MSQPNTIPLDYAVIPFEPVEEFWNEYSFSDGTVVKFRTLVTRITRKKDTPSGQYDISFNNISIVIAPPSNRGQPTAPILPHEIDTLNKFEVKPITTAEQ